MKADLYRPSGVVGFTKVGSVDIPEDTHIIVVHQLSSCRDVYILDPERTGDEKPFYLEPSQWIGIAKVTPT